MTVDTRQNCQDHWIDMWCMQRTHSWHLWCDMMLQTYNLLIKVLCCTHPGVSLRVGVSWLSPLVIHWLPRPLSASRHHPLPGLPGLPGLPVVVGPELPVLPPLHHLPVWLRGPGPLPACLKQMVLIGWPAPMTRHATGVHVERGPVWPAAAPARTPILSLLTWAWGAVSLAC